MKKRSFLPLLGLLFFIILIYLSVQMSALLSYTTPLIIMELKSAMLVFGVAFALYYGAFLTIWDKTIKLKVFKLHWLQEVLLLTGIFGAILGAIFMSAAFGEEEMARGIGSGMATGFISFLYGLLGATVVFLIEKHLNTKVIAEQFESRTIKSGLNIRSMLGLLLLIFMLFLVFLIISGESEIDPVGILFNLPIAFLMLAVAMLSLLIYGRKTMLHVIKVPFWRANHDEDRLLSLIQAARGSKRIIALLGLATVVLTPIAILKGMSPDPGDVPGAVPLLKTATILLWCLFMILYLTLAEAQVAQQVYFRTGIIPREDRFFIFKFILPPFFMVLMLAWFNFIWLIVIWLAQSF